MKLAHHIQSASSSISVKKQIGDFDRHVKYRKMHEKVGLKQRKGSSAFVKNSPKNLKIKDALKLPPLHFKPFGNTELKTRGGPQTSTHHESQQIGAGGDTISDIDFSSLKPKSRREYFELHSPKQLDKQFLLS